MAKRFGAGYMLIAAPYEYDQINHRALSQIDGKDLGRKKMKSKKFIIGLLVVVLAIVIYSLLFVMWTGK